MNDLLKVARRVLFFLVLFGVALAATRTAIAADELEEARPGNDVACPPAGFQNPQQYCYDGSRLLVAHGSVALLCDLNSGKEIRRFVGHQETLQAVLFSPDGTR
jgi:hypothetical protein